jgi:hypothetical protein
VISALYLFYNLDPVLDAANLGLIVAFAAGGSLAVCKSSVPLHPAIAVALALIAATATATTHVGGPLFYAAVAYALLLVFTLPAVRRARLSGDYSYGVYIYGFPVQQAFAHVFPTAAPLTNAAWSALLSLAIAVMSWRLVEHPAMVFGRTLSCGKLMVAPALALMMLGLAPLALCALPGWGELDPLPSDLRINAFGPSPVTHGRPFNVAPTGESALWARATRPLRPEALLIIGGVALKSVVSDNLITAAVPMALFRNPAAITIVIQEQRDGHPSPSAPVIWEVR